MLLPDQGYVAVQGDDLGVFTNDLRYIYISVHGAGLAIEGSVPAQVLHVGGEVLALEDDLSPAVEDGQRLDVIEPVAAGVEPVVDAIAVGGEGVGEEIVVAVADGLYQHGVGSHAEVGIRHGDGVLGVEDNGCRRGGAVETVQVNGR